MHLDRFVQQEEFLTRGDQFPFSDAPHCKIDTRRRVSVGAGVHWRRIERGPVGISFEPRSLSGKIHGLAARRHLADIGRNPGWIRLVWTWVPFVLKFPALRLGT